MTYQNIRMSEKEKTISSLVLRLAMTGLIAGVVIGAFAAFRESQALAIVSVVESLYWILAIFLSVQLVVKVMDTYEITVYEGLNAESTSTTSSTVFLLGSDAEVVRKTTGKP